MFPIDQRRLAHARRGLAAYPEDLPGDAERLDGIAALLDRCDGPIRMRLPAFDLAAEVPPWVGARTLYLLAVDDYETADLALMSRLLAPEDRFMVLGGGIGIAAALGARLTGGEVVVVEANEALHGTILRQVAINGGRAEVVGAAVVADAEAYAGGTVAFAVAEEFWYSRIAEAAGRGAATVQVPVRSFQDLCDLHRPTAVLIDIEGAEVSVLARPVPETLRTVIVEIHTPELGAPMTGALITGLVNQGFRVADQQGLTWAFIR